MLVLEYTWLEKEYISHGGGLVIKMAQTRLYSNSGTYACMC